MDSRRRTLDRISILPDCLLVLIVSSLPFKDALKTSLLSRRWKNICRETINISFKESEFVTSPIINVEETKRAAFVHYVVDWVSKFSGTVIDTFEFCLSKTAGFETEINSLIEFAVSKKVKNLLLDYSNPLWITNGDAIAEQASMFQLPECVYHLTNFVSLKLCFCGFDPSRLAFPGSLKSLCFAWIELKNITSLLLRSPFLETLRIKTCWNVGLEAITGYNNRLTKLVIKNCGFAVEYSTLDLPNIQIFRYSGTVHYFEFMRVNRIMEEVYLDFGEETEIFEDTGSQLCGLLYNLLSARTLTICPFLLQLIQDGEDPVRLQAPMETRQLIMNINLLPSEFVGIRLMINSCPDLETLIFQMVAPRPVSSTLPDINPDTYWRYEMNHKCLKKTLKFVEVWNFTGAVYEGHVLQFLIRYGRVLERVDLYLPSGMVESPRLLARAAAERFGATFLRGSERLRIYLHNG